MKKLLIVVGVIAIVWYISQKNKAQAATPAAPGGLSEKDKHLEGRRQFLRNELLQRSNDLKRQIDNLYSKKTMWSVSGSQRMVDGIQADINRLEAELRQVNTELAQVV